MATRHSDRLRSRWLFLSILYVVLFSFPLLRVFDRNILIFGIPLLILYLLLGWLLFIWLIYRFTQRLDPDGGAGVSDRDEEGEEP
jgi:hypothetical protein